MNSLVSHESIATSQQPKEASFAGKKTARGSWLAAHEKFFHSPLVHLPHGR